MSAALDNGEDSCLLEELRLTNGRLHMMLQRMIEEQHPDLMTEK
jgi:hypothetical protein